MKRMHLLLSALVLGFAPAGTIDAEPFAPEGPQSSCREVPEPFVAPIPKSHRQDAARLLGGAQFVGLTDRQAANLLGEPFGRTSLASVRLDRAISRMKAQRRAALKGAPEGSWSFADEEAFTRLIQLRAKTAGRPPHPFLVRAAVGLEGTGAFTAEQCGGRLAVHHGSLGRSNPTPRSVPVIVLLSGAPTRVHTDYSVAE
jgi:hypothetical protein